MVMKRIFTVARNTAVAPVGPVMLKADWNTRCHAMYSVNNPVSARVVRVHRAKVVL